VRGAPHASTHKGGKKIRKRNERKGAEASRRGVSKEEKSPKRMRDLRMEGLLYPKHGNGTGRGSGLAEQ